jgi:hypothetical protein
MRHLLLLLIAVITITFGERLLQTEVGLKSSYAQPQTSDTEGELEDLEDLESAPTQKTVRAKTKAKTSPKKTNPKKAARKKRAKRAKNKRLKVTQVQTKKGRGNSSSSEVYLQQIQRIESQVNELKEEIFRSRTRLAILKESVLASGLSGTELRIVHRNQMGANFKLERILYILDGSPIRQAVDRDGELDQQEEIEILNGPIAPGNYTLQVELIYRGNGFGVFSYLQSYRFTLNDVSTFRAEEGKRVTISAIGYERSGMTLELKDRPDIRFERAVVDLDEEAEKAAKTEDTKKTESEPKP